MRLLIAIAALAAVSTAYAQRDGDERQRRIDGAATSVRPGHRDRDDWEEHQRTPERRHGPKASKPTDGKSSITVVRPLEREDESKPMAPASKSTESMDGAPPLTIVRPIPDTPPSKAEQMQRQMNEQRRNQRGEQATSSGNFRCTAYPLCERSSGSYGSCRGVEQLYWAKSARFARQQVARDCAAANNPDPCNCAAQCSRVAQCGAI